MSRPQPNDPSKSGIIEGTRLETVDEIRQVLQGRRPATARERREPDTVAFRPVHRPPMAVLFVIDDGGEEGECVRLRGDQVVIGRSDGDIRIPHDTMVSSRHAMLSRTAEPGGYRWYLSDLQSTNGTYVRIGSARLRHLQEVLIGGNRFRFDAAPQGAALAASASPEADPPPGTRDWQSVAPTSVLPSLVELTPAGEGQRYFLTQADNWVGRDAEACVVALLNDPLVSPRHARLYRDAKGRWLVENTKSLNGVWLRVDRMPLDQPSAFQLGEQRFLFRVV